MRKKYNHMFDVAFSVDSDYEYDKVPAEELLDALKKRVAYLEATMPDILEAFGYSDSYEHDSPVGENSNGRAS